MFHEIGIRKLFYAVLDSIDEPRNLYLYGGYCATLPRQKSSVQNGVRMNIM